MTSTGRLRLAALAGCALWLVVVVAWRHAPFTVTFDDAYYYFTIGRNLANGHGSTFDLLDRTNGYHPLWQGISTLPYLAGLDGTAAVRSLLALQVVLWAATLWLVCGKVGEAIGGWPLLVGARERRRPVAELVVGATLVVLVVNPFVVKMVVNGLESGVEVPVLALLLSRAIGIRGRFVTAQRRERLAFGALLALAFLARTDAVLLFAAVGLWVVVDGGTPADPAGTGRRARAAVEVLALPALVTVAYLAFNQAAFGTALQISGTVKRVPLTPARLGVAAVWLVAAVAATLGARRPARRSKVPRVRRFLRSTGWCAGFCILLLGYYTTLQAVPYLWYFCPLALYGLWLLLLFVADLVEGGLAEAPEKTSSAVAAVPGLVLVVVLAAGLGWQVRSFADPGVRSLLEHDAAAGRWADSNLPRGAVLASWDAGAIGYFSHRSVVNLDGVVNGTEWQDARDHGRTGPFLRARHVGWIVNHGIAVDGEDPSIREQADALFGPGTGVRLALTRSWLFRYSGSFDGARTDTSDKRAGVFVYAVPPA